jgi:UPF0271 protein
VQVDLNADVGEGLPDIEAEVIPLMTSVNVACGVHAGDAHSMSRSVALAVQHGVVIGAHPGFDDREGFGRRHQDLHAPAVIELIVYQLGALEAIARTHGAMLRHVKPHGALYNQAESDAALAVAIIAAIRSFDPRLRLVGRAGSAMQRAATGLNHPFTPEAFADRRYRPDGSLLPRSEPGAVLVNGDDVAGQVTAMITHREIVASDGSRQKIAFETLCLHGDTPGAPALAARVRQELDRLGVRVSAPQSLAVDTLPP